jgi:signal transduction histidine kinase
MRLDGKVWRGIGGLVPQILLACAISAITFLVRWTLDPLLGDRQPYTLSFASIALAAWFGGWRCGALTAVICFLWSSYFFTDPRGSFLIDGPVITRISSYLFINVVIIYLAHRATVALEAVKEASRQKDAFLATLSHELRNPLQGIAVAGAIIEKTREEELLRRATKMLSRQTRQLRTLLDDLLDLSRITRGRIELKPELFNLAECVQDAIDENAEIIATKYQDLAVAILPESFEIEADRTRVTQMIANLINNAAKYSPDGASIRVRATYEGGDAVISVKDNGPGIDPTILNHIFEGFYQHPDTELHEHGLGIGLWLTRRLAELHGGRITAHSEGAGKGSEFVIKLPSRLAAHTRT